jgi:hypothetical protein
LTNTGIGGITQIQKLKTASIILMGPIKNGRITRRLVRFWFGVDSNQITIDITVWSIE